MSILKGTENKKKGSWTASTVHEPFFVVKSDFRQISGPISNGLKKL